MAPPHLKTMWLGLGGVSAGIGNGIGTAVAGFTTAAGLRYSFAFQLQAAVLGGLLVYMLFLPARLLSTVLPEKELLADGDGKDASSQRSLDSSNPCSGAGSSSDSTPTQKPPSVSHQVQALSQTPVFTWTAIAISSAMFQMSGIQFLWVRVFVEVWELDKSMVTLMFLLVTGIGGGIGIALGPGYIDRAGGYSDPPGVVRTLGILQRFCSVSAIAGMVGAGCLYGRLRGKDAGYWHGWGDHWLWLTFAAVFFIWGARNACVPGLCGLNVEVVDGKMRTFAAGAEMSMRNLLGYAAGPLLPGLFMDAVATSYGWDVKNDESSANWQLSSGLGLIFVSNLLDLVILSRARKAAERELEADQNETIKLLSEAINKQDLAALKKAHQRGKVLDVHKSDEGCAPMSFADGILSLGTFPTDSNAERAASELQKLKERNTELEAENTLLRSELLQMKQLQATWCAPSTVGRPTSKDELEKLPLKAHGTKVKNGAFSLSL
eukprot:TRINITY_DN21525_c0_g3_i1.p1 TRINITY_DN21525_c0_g3~~TRINITY_DN21525_c0_g3_i1.p1  ORF type:complete len:502 (+),score=101.61 TRINITY_DN21525_c0_g3_i1:32-1507(+)